MVLRTQIRIDRLDTLSPHSSPGFGLVQNKSRDSHGMVLERWQNLLRSLCVRRASATRSKTNRTK